MSEPIAVRVTGENIARNEFATTPITVEVGSVELTERFAGRYELVIANVVTGSSSDSAGPPRGLRAGRAAESPRASSPSARARSRPALAAAGLVEESTSTRWAIGAASRGCGGRRTRSREL